MFPASRKIIDDTFSRKKLDLDFLEKYRSNPQDQYDMVRSFFGDHVCLLTKDLCEILNEDKYHYISKFNENITVDQGILNQNKFNFDTYSYIWFKIDSFNKLQKKYAHFYIHPVYIYFDRPLVSFEKWIYHLMNQYIISDKLHKYNILNACEITSDYINHFVKDELDSLRKYSVITCYDLFRKCKFYKIQFGLMTNNNNRITKLFCYSNYDDCIENKIEATYYSNEKELHARNLIDIDQFDDMPLINVHIKEN